MFKHFRKLKRTAIWPHLEYKDQSARSSKARANLLMEYFATFHRETSAISMPEYTESGSFDLKICRDAISQIAKKILISKARGLDALPSLLYLLYVRTANTLIHSLYNVYRNTVRTYFFKSRPDVLTIYTTASEI